MTTYERALSIIRSAGERGVHTKAIWQLIGRNSKDPAVLEALVKDGRVYSSRSHSSAGRVWRAITQPRDDKGIDNRATQRILDDLGITPEQASPATYRGMPAGDFDGLDPKGKTPRMGPDPLLAKIDRAWKTVNRIADDRDFGGVLGADGQVYSDADPGL